MPGLDLMLDLQPCSCGSHSFLQNPKGAVTPFLTKAQRRLLLLARDRSSCPQTNSLSLLELESQSMINMKFCRDLILPQRAQFLSWSEQNDDQVELLTAEQCREPEQERRELCALCCICLDVLTPSNEHQDEKSLSSLCHPEPDQEQGKETSLTSYTRVVVFADVLDPPKCYAVILQTEEQVKHFFMMTLHCCRPIIGCPFYLVQPRLSKTTIMGKDVVSIRDVSPVPLMPLFTSFIHNNIPEISPRFYAGIEDQPCYYVLQGHQLKMADLNFVAESAKCSGHFCDFHKLSSDTSKCGCMLSTTDNYCLAIEVNVCLRFPKVSDQTAIVTSTFRSKAFAESMLKDYDATSKAALSCKDYDIKLYQNLFQRLVGAVNDHGGWTVVGWCTYGKEEQEESCSSTLQADQQEELAISPRISYLMPTNIDWFDNDKSVQNLLLPIPSSKLSAKRRRHHGHHGHHRHSHHHSSCSHHNKKSSRHKASSQDCYI